MRLIKPNSPDEPRSGDCRRGSGAIIVSDRAVWLASCCRCYFRARDAQFEQRRLPSFIVITWMIALRRWRRGLAPYAPRGDDLKIHVPAANGSSTVSAA